MATILIVEDSPTCREYLASLLSNHRLVQAGDGMEALAKVRDEHPDLVITDIVMPKVDGYEFVRQLRSEPAIAATPVIFYTDKYHLWESSSLARDAGVLYQFVKPVEADELRRVVDEVLTTAPAAAPLPPSPGFAHQHLRLVTDRLARDVELLQEQVAERKRVEEELRRQEEKLHGLVEFQQAVMASMGEGLYTVDPQGLVTYINPAAERLFGWAGGELLGRKIHEATHYRRPDGTPFPVEECAEVQVLRQGTASMDREDVFIRKDGTLFPVLVSSSRVSTENKVGLVVVFRDVSQQKQAEKALRDHAVRLEVSIRELDRFAHSASHDLKAPLRGVQNLAQWIADDAGPVLPKESKQHLQLLRQRVGRMERLLDDLLAFSRVGRVHHEAVNVDTRRLVEEVVALLAVPPDIAVDVGDLPPLLAQHPPLEQVFRNLIGNAVKHHDRPAGKVEIWAVDQGDMVEFAVRDDGPGIAAEYHEKVFEMFQTLKPRDKVEGSGMGLALVKKIVENQGGQVILTSLPGHGATFRFTWPKKIGSGEGATEFGHPATRGGPAAL